MNLSVVYRQLAGWSWANQIEWTLLMSYLVFLQISSTPHLSQESIDVNAKSMRHVLVLMDASHGAQMEGVCHFMYQN